MRKLGSEEPASLKTSTLADMLREHFDLGVAWSITSVFAHKMDKTTKRGKIDGCRNRDELWRVTPGWMQSTPI